MSIKRRAFIVSFGTIGFIVSIMAIMIYSYILSDFQTVENQRAERSLKSLKFALSDKLIQLDSKIGGWAIWDDTYDFMVDRNKDYIDSNLVKESFAKLGVDEVLFINNEGGLVKSFLANNERVRDDFPEDIYSHFATGSSSIQLNSNEKHKNGILETEDGLLLFSIASVYKSNGTGPAHGALVFASYFDSHIIQSIEKLTQSKTTFVAWKDIQTSDFIAVKNEFKHGKREQIKILNSSIISGYYIIIDVYGKPQGILRIDITRDITIQGKVSMTTVLILLIISGLLGASINFWLVNGVVLKKILTISEELKDLRTRMLKKRLIVNTGHDEIDTLRLNINSMLDSIEDSQKQLKVLTETKESILGLIDAVVIILDKQARIIQVNKKGCEMFGYTNDELVGINWIENIIIPEQRELMKQKFAEIMSSNMSNNVYIENSILTKDKKIITFGWRNTIIYDSHGIVTSTLSVGNDITVQKIEEERKDKYTRSLKEQNEIMVGRELKMIELKKRIAELERKI